MNKEFEDLLIEFDEMGYEPTTLCENPQREIETFRNRLKQALTELQAIKEAKPSEALEELNEIIEYITEDKRVKYKATILFDCKIIEQVLLNVQEQEKVLEIIIKKGIDIGWLRQCKTVEEYNYHCEAKRLTQEEFELLKRWCEKCQK